MNLLLRIKALPLHTRVQSVDYATVFPLSLSPTWRFLSLCQPEDELPLKQECLSMPETTSNTELKPLSHAGEHTHEDEQTRYSKGHFGILQCTIKFFFFSSGMKHLQLPNYQMAETSSFLYYA